jgi:hypothetical protein
MNEQQIRDHERSKVIAYIRRVARDLRQFDNSRDAVFLDEIVGFLEHPNWVNDTKDFRK